MAEPISSIIQIWNITAVDVVEQLDTRTKVITRILWTLETTDLFGGVYVNCGSTQVDPTNIAGFTDFDNLTEAQMLSWIDPEFKKNMELQGQHQALALMRPEMLTKTLPW